MSPGKGAAPEYAVKYSGKFAMNADPAGFKRQFAAGSPERALADKLTGGKATNGEFMLGMASLGHHAGTKTPAYAAASAYTGLETDTAEKIAAQAAAKQASDAKRAAKALATYEEKYPAGSRAELVRASEAWKASSGTLSPRMTDMVNGTKLAMPHTSALEEGKQNKHTAAILNELKTNATTAPASVYRGLAFSGHDIKNPNPGIAKLLSEIAKPAGSEIDIAPGGFTHNEKVANRFNGNRKANGGISMTMEIHDARGFEIDKLGEQEGIINSHEKEFITGGRYKLLGVDKTPDPAGGEHWHVKLKQVKGF